MARPTKLTEPIAKQIELAVRDGASYRVAAKHAGVSERTFHRWMTRGQDEQERIEAAEAREASERSCCPRRAEKSFWQFWQRIEQADAEAQVRAAAQISAAAAKDWRAAAWLLERRDPATFGPPQARLSVEGVAEAPPIVAVDDEEAADAAHEFLRRIHASTRGNGTAGGRAA
jgi:hypothetical protein